MKLMYNLWDLPSNTFPSFIKIQPIVNDIQAKKQGTHRQADSQIKGERSHSHTDFDHMYE